MARPGFRRCVDVPLSGTHGIVAMFGAGRIAETVQRMEVEAVAAETIDGIAEPFEMRLNETAMAEDISEAALSAYARAVGEEPSLELLVRRGLMSKRSERLTNAGTLLFARRPGKHLVRAEVMVEVRAAVQREILKKRGWKLTVSSMSHWSLYYLSQSPTSTSC